LDNVLRLTRDDIAGEPGHGTHRLVNGQSENSTDIVSDPISKYKYGESEVRACTPRGMVGL